MQASHWVTTFGHPDGGSTTVSWFRIEGVLGFRDSGHPQGASSEPCLKVVDGKVYPMPSLPSRTAPSFEVIGSFVYPTGSCTPWFRVVPTLGSER
jgi:hypothetical protein